MTCKGDAVVRVSDIQDLGVPASRRPVSPPHPRSEITCRQHKQIAFWAGFGVLVEAYYDIEAVASFEHSMQQ